MTSRLMDAEAASIWRKSAVLPITRAASRNSLHPPGQQWRCQTSGQVQLFGVLLLPGRRSPREITRLCEYPPAAPSPAQVLRGLCAAVWDLRCS